MSHGKAGNEAASMHLSYTVTVSCLQLTVDQLLGHAASHCGKLATYFLWSLLHSNVVLGSCAAVTKHELVRTRTSTRTHKQLASQEQLAMCPKVVAMTGNDADLTS